MKVRECMTTDMKVCIPENSCATAGEIMRRRQCGFMPIVDSLKTKRVVGVVTDRDLMLQLVHQRPARHVAVKVCMTKSPTTISSEASLEEAVHVMKRAAVRQLPVVDGGQLVGVLSLLDIALAVRRQWAYVGPSVTEQHVTDIIEAIAVDREDHTVTMKSQAVPKRKGGLMKAFASVLVVICVLGVLSGCHSGIMRGAGSDVERLGNRMQK